MNFYFANKNMMIKPTLIRLLLPC